MTNRNMDSEPSLFLVTVVYPHIQEHPNEALLAYYLCIKARHMAFYMLDSTRIRMHLRKCDICTQKAKYLQEAIPEDILALVVADIAYLEGLQRLPE